MKPLKPSKALAEQITSAMGHALTLAREAGAQNEVPVGAVILDSQGRIIGRGKNIREAANDPLGHAEIVAIREATQTLGSWRLVDCTLVVTLEPCPMCLAACQQARVDQVVYAATDPKGGALSLGFDLHTHTKLNHRFDVRRIADLTDGDAQTGDHPQIREASALLSDFFKAKRK